MMRRIVKPEVIVPALLLIAMMLHGCHTETEEDKVKKVITTVQKAAENKDVKEVLSHVSKTYHDPQGNDYEGIKGILLFYFFRHQNVSIFIPELDVAVHDGAAAAKFQAVLSGRSKGAGDILPEALGVYVFDVSLAREEGKWKVTSAKWERFADTLPEKPQ